MLNPVRFFLGFFIFLLLPGRASAQDGELAAGRTLSTTEQVQRLSRSEATNRIPVRLRGVVTFSRNSPRTLFLEDSTGGIYLESGLIQRAPPVGRLLDVEGYALRSELLPVVLVSQVHERGPAPLPEARRVSAAQLKEGRFDGDFVRIRGRVIEVNKEFGEVPVLWLRLNSDGGEVEAYVSQPATGLIPQGLLGSLVEVEGVFGPEHDESGHVGRVVLLSAQPEMLHVLATQDEVVRSLQPLSLAQLIPKVSYPVHEPVRVVGVVSLTNREACFITDFTNGLRIMIGKAAQFRLGDRVEVFGLTRTNAVGRWVDLVKLLSHAPGKAPQPAPFSIDELFQPTAYGRPVTAKAFFLHRIPSPAGDVLVMADGSPDMAKRFDVQLRYNAASQLRLLASGSQLRVSGVLWQQFVGQEGQVSPRILIGEPGGLVLLTPPPWPLSRTLFVLSSLAACLAIGLVLLARSHRRLRLSNRSVAAAERQLKELNAELELRIQARTLELEAANRRLTGEVSEGVRLSRIQAEQSKVLQMIAQGAPLSETLDQLLRAVEFQSPEMFASILLLEEDGHHLTQIAAPRLPKAYGDSLRRVPIGPAVGSCGTAAYRKQRVFVDDLTLDPLWKDYPDLVRLSGMRACWSSPIFDLRQQLLGTFAIYTREPGRPTERQIQQIGEATHTAAICISRLRAEQSLRQSESRFRALVERTEVIVWEFDPAINAMTYVSPQASRLGHPMEAWLSPGFWQDHLHPDERDRVVGFFEREVRQGNDHEDQYRFATATGDYVWFAGKVSVESRSGGASILRGIFMDITERKRAEETQARLKAQLHQAQKLEAIGTLAGGIAHDFNNLLGAIIGYAELARIQSANNARAIESLNDLMRASFRARDLVKQILTFSRREEQAHGVIALEPILEESIRLLRATLPATIELRSRVVDPVPCIRGDSTLIHQVIMNLGANAAQAIGDRPGTIDIELMGVMCRSGEPSSRPELAPGRYVRLAVRDNGPGIDPAVRDRIFEPFFTTKERGKGTGLGLSVVHGILQAHDGVLHLESQPGCGAAFEIYFPALEEAVSAPTPEPASAAPISSRGQGTILLVDDEEALLSIGQRLLRGMGYTVVTALTPAQALSIFRENPGHFDLLITDYTMPGCTGLDLAGEIRKLRPNLPMLICTGYGASLTREVVVRSGFHDVLLKPVERATLLGAVRAALSGGRGVHEETPLEAGDSPAMMPQV